ncbi:MAG: regulatory protein RecX [Candidatus Methylomirabilales bacterium]
MPSPSSADWDAATRAALRLLAVRARSCHEIVDRLRRRGFAAEVISGVVQNLTARGLVDDRAFALHHARTRVQSRHISSRRLQGELRDKGVAEEIVKATVREVFQEINEEEIARAGAARRLKALGRLSPNVVRRRLAAYLLRRGFSSETVRRTVTTLVKDKY